MQFTRMATDLAVHAEWADALVWNAALAAPDDEKVRTLLWHIHNVQQAFLHAWQELPIDFPDLGTFESPAAIARWGRAVHGRLRLYVGGVAEAALDREIRVPWAARMAEVLKTEVTHPSLGETIQQVYLHSTYHRGQVNLRLRELGAEPPLTDFIAWIWRGRPPAAWPEETA